MGATCKGSDVRRREIPGVSDAELFVKSALGDEHKAEEEDEEVGDGQIVLAEPKPDATAKEA